MLRAEDVLSMSDFGGRHQEGSVEAYRSPGRRWGYRFECGAMLMCSSRGLASSS